MVIFAVFGFVAFLIWLGVQTAAREAERRHELYKQMLEHPGPAADALRELLERDARRGQQERRRGMNVGGLITAAVGILVTMFFYLIAPGQPIWLLGLVPLAVGLILLAAAWRTTPGAGPAGG